MNKIQTEIHYDNINMFWTKKHGQRIDSNMLSAYIQYEEIKRNYGINEIYIKALKGVLKQNKENKLVFVSDDGSGLFTTDYLIKLELTKRYREREKYMLTIPLYKKRYQYWRVAKTNFYQFTKQYRDELYKLKHINKDRENEIVSDICISYGTDKIRMKYIITDPDNFKVACNRYW